MCCKTDKVVMETAYTANTMVVYEDEVMLRPRDLDCKITSLRGNKDTRLDKTLRPVGYNTLCYVITNLDCVIRRVHRGSEVKKPLFL
jgi:hypothetical protein